MRPPHLKEGGLDLNRRRGHRPRSTLFQIPYGNIAETYEKLRRFRRIHLVEVPQEGGDVGGELIAAVVGAR